MFILCGSSRCTGTAIKVQSAYINKKIRSIFLSNTFLICEEESLSDMAHRVSDFDVSTNTNIESHLLSHAGK